MTLVRLRPNNNEECIRNRELTHMFPFQSPQHRSLPRLVFLLPLALGNNSINPAVELDRGGLDLPTAPLAEGDPVAVA